MLYLFARRFVAGETCHQALERAKSLTKQGFRVTLDCLGEHVKDLGATRQIVEEYNHLLEEIKKEGMDATVSVKATHLGLDISEETALKNIGTVLTNAKKLKNFVRIDMEGSPYTEATLRIFYRLHKEFSEHVGLVIQAYLYRSEEDIEDLIMKKARARLCKGAYKEPSSIAFRTKEDVNANFDRLCELLIKHADYPAIATHDELRIRNAIAYARLHGRSPQDFEFQMLLGIRPGLARDLINSGYRVRLYLPYGREWFSYFYRRVRERKENLYFVLRNLFKD